MLLNAARVKQESTATTDGTIAHERGHHENEYRLTRVLWAAACFVPMTIAALEAYFTVSPRQVIRWVGVFSVILFAAMWWSRWAEYRADRFAVERLKSPEPVLAMLRGMQGTTRATKTEPRTIPNARIADGALSHDGSTPIHYRPNGSSRSSAMSARGRTSETNKT